MSDAPIHNGKPAEGDNPEPQGGQSGTYTPPATQADLDRIIADRLTRERAKYADYDEIKTKAAEHDKAVEAQKTEIQKALDRATAAEAKAAVFEKRDEIAAWAKEIVKGSPVPADALRGETEDELKAHFEQLKSLIPAEPPKKGALAPYVPSEGQQPSALSLNGDGIEDALRAKLGIA